MSLELWGLFSSSLVAATLLPGGSELALAWLIHKGEVSTPVLLAIAISGNSLGGILTLLMGLFISKYFPAKNLHKPYQVKALQWINNKGSVVLLLSWLPFIGDPLCLIAGWLRLNFLLCCLFIISGKALRYLLIATLLFEPIIE